MSLTELSAWFQYLDKDKSPYNPTVGDLITVEKFWDKKSSKYNLPDWRKEQWQISSALVPVNPHFSQAMRSLLPKPLSSLYFERFRHCTNHNTM